ncbi:unnamed protein product [Linum tenue]|uniref:Uncharacterized protein n=1 Tax=Linum tenue TaxID=586396 RepID=A0AAV0LJ14_9ROSI|nr:unnamed protein product [Linum tenue]
MQAPSAATADEEQQQQQQRKAVAVKSKKCLSKQLSMCETPRDVAWERRRRQILSQERRKRGIPVMESSEDLTDEDLNELKGCIELGFGFNEEKGQHLTNTFPALDLYFAVNRQLSPSPVSTPNRRSLERQQTLDSPKSDPEKDWKICNPGTYIPFFIFIFIIPLIASFCVFLRSIQLASLTKKKCH